MSRLPTICLLVPLLSLTAAAQNRPSGDESRARIPANPASPAESAVRKFADQPYVIEQYTTKVRFDPNGAESRTVLARVRIQSALAAQKFSRLAFNYDQSAETFEFRTVQIFKPGGTQTKISSSSAKDVPAAVTRDAPAYESYREKSVAVPNLQPGDTLQYEIAWRSQHPQIGAPFWMRHAFLADAIVLQEILEMDVPKSRHVTLKSPHDPYSSDTTSSPNVVSYRWVHSNLALPADDTQENSAPQPVRMKPVDVNVTSFATWDDVARWYSRLAPESGASAEVRAKATELTQGLASQAEKTQAIYDFVSKSIRYVDLPFAAAAHESHTGAQVLAQQYSTATDKRVLLAALLAAAGIPSQTALLSDAARFDNSFPSPADFDRVLTAVHENDRTVWLDPSSGFAPFEFLPASLRNKTALLIAPGGSSKLAGTPADPPFPSTQRVEIEGRVTALGKLTARIRYELRGDNEYVLRLAFHRTPEKQWKELAQTMLALDGVHGEISSVTPSDPAATQAPFLLQIEYSQPDFLDWASPRQRIAIPLLALGMPDPPKDHDGAGPTQGIELGSPLTITAQLTLAFPENFAARPPVAVGVSREYAEFHSSYHFDGHVLTAQRSLDFKMRSLASSRAADYLAFSRAVAADQAQPLLIENPAANTTAIPPASPTELFEAGSAALAAGNTPSSIPLLERALQLQPDHPEAWNKLGLSYMRARQFALAAAAFQKQIGVNPADPQAHNYLGLALQQQHKNDDAIAAFRQQITLDPLDQVAHEALGALYLDEHAYTLALPELDKAAVLSPEKPALQLALGEAYASLAQDGQAIAAFAKAAALSHSPGVSNAVARGLADHDLDLAKALKYAQSAVSEAAADLQKIDPAHISAGQFSAEANLANYWDTLGWVYYHQGNLDAAERYLRAAWIWSERGETAAHLARVFEKRGQKDQAVRAYALALAARDPGPDARARLTLLLGGNSRIPELLDQARPALASLHTFHLPQAEAAAGGVSSEVLLVLSPVAGRTASSRASAVRLTNPGEELRAVANRLSSLDFGPAFADASVPKLARRATLACSSESAGCTLTLSSLDSADTTDTADTANAR